METGGYEGLSGKGLLQNISAVHCQVYKCTWRHPSLVLILGVMVMNLSVKHLHGCATFTQRYCSGTY